MSSTAKIGAFRKIVSKAIRGMNRASSKRSKGGFFWAIRKIFSYRKPKESFHLEFKRGSGTACWKLEKSSSGNPLHCITFFSSLEDMFDAEGMNDRLKMQGCKNVFRHEIGHALFTPRDPKVIIKLKAEGIPFPLYNLFEDCRIEFKLVQNFKDHGLFYWHKYQKGFSSLEKPTDALFHLKLSEAGSRVARAKTLKTLRFLPLSLCSPDLKKHRAKISWFYDEIIKVSDSDFNQMLKLLRLWIKKFGSDMPIDPSTGEVLEGSIKEDSLDKADPDGKTPDLKEEAEAEADSKPEAERIERISSKRTSDLSEFDTKLEGSDLDKKEARHKAGILKPIIKKAKLKPRESGRKGRLHVGRAIQGFADAFLRSAPSDGKRDVYLLIDMSGSMQYLWKSGMASLASAFFHLRDQDLINLKCFLTKGEEGNAILADVSKLSADQILTLRPNGSEEMIKDALDNTAPDLIRSDVCFILTDADIVDEPVDPNYWRRKGVDLVGCVAHPESIERESITAWLRRSMNEHFSKSFIESSATALGRRMLRYAMRSKAK